MPRKIIFFIKSLLLSLVIIGNIFAAEISIIPLKKPILDEEVKRQKISQGILKLCYKYLCSKDQMLL